MLVPIPQAYPNRKVEVLMGKLDKLDIALIAISMLAFGTAAGIALCKFCPELWKWVW